MAIEAEQPERIVAAPAGDAAGFVVGPRVDGPGEATGVWWGPLSGSPRRISEQVPDTGLAVSPDGSHLAFGTQEQDGSTLHLTPTDGGEASTIALGGYVEALAWTADGLLALAAQPGADSASLTSGRPLPGADGDPRVIATGTGWRQLWAIAADADAGRPPHPLTKPGVTVWEFSPLPGGGAVAVCSDDPREDGWYRPFLARIAPAPGGEVEVLHRSDWQLSTPAADPAGRRLAFAEGWSSDRGLLAGELRLLDLADPSTGLRTLETGIDVTWLSWDADGRLWLAGWDHLGTAWGWFDDVEEDAPPVLQREPAGCVNSRWHPAVVPLVAPEPTALAARSTSERPPEVVHLSPGAAAAPWTALNAGVPARRFAVQEVRWLAADGLELEGLLAMPRNRSAPPKLVVDIHGGPSIAFHHQWSLTWAEVLTAAGFAVLMPNPRGGVGRGQAFARLNLGDAAGGELEDVIAGARHCAAAGLVDDGRPGAIGGSYGGYLTAWAVCRPDMFSCGVVIAGVTDLLSCRGTANNNAFYDFLMQGTPLTAGPEYLRRSPVAAVDARTAPALILHGEQDQCVPLGQAHELHYALRAAGVETELVVYPREGHQTAEPAHVADQRRRVLDWFHRHLAAP
jgi:dipeptidyl aminopeptidase/acylaminoacyl peptidase